MSDLVGNPEDRFSHNEANIGTTVRACAEQLQGKFAVTIKDAQEISFKQIIYCCNWRLVSLVVNKVFTGRLVYL